MSRNGPEAIDRALQNHDGIVVLEDDCIPKAGFFEYILLCDDLLSQKDSVAVYSGYNPIGTTPFLRGPFSIARNGTYWGHYIKKKHWIEFRTHGTQTNRSVLTCLHLALDRPGLFSKIVTLRINLAHRKDAYPDILMDLFFLKRRYHFAMPSSSLIENIGVGASAAHTRAIPSIKLKPIGLRKNLNKKVSLRPVKRISIIYGWLTLIWWSQQKLIKAKSSA
jgi:hypothetical protein